MPALPAELHFLVFLCGPWKPPSQTLEGLDNVILLLLALEVTSFCCGCCASVSKGHY